MKKEATKTSSKKRGMLVLEKRQREQETLRLADALIKRIKKRPALLTAEQLGQELGVGARTIKEWKRNKMIPYIAPTDATVRYDLDDVIRALKRNYGYSPVE